MTNSTEVAVRKVPTAEAVLTRRIEAHAIGAQSQIQLAAAMVEVYARTEGLPLQPIRYWFLSTGGPQPVLNGTLATPPGSLAHEKRQWLREWAEVLGAEAKETRDYSSQVKLRATCVVRAGVRGDRRGPQLHLHRPVQRRRPVTGLEWLLVFAVACAVALAVLVVLELMSEPEAVPERFTPLPELLAYEPRHAAPVSPFAAWRTR